MHNDDKHPPVLDTQKLQKLYPAPLSYDEKLAERREARKIRLSHQPRHPMLLAIGILVGLALSLGVLIMILPSIFTGPGALCMGLLFIIGLYVAITTGISKVRELNDLDTDDEAPSGRSPRDT